MTRPIITTLSLLALTLFVGCVGQEKGPAYGQQQEIRRQIADTAPVKKWGYSIADVKLSDDAQKILVVFASPKGTNHTEVILEHDGFRRYSGTVFSEERKAAAAEALFVETTNNMARAGAGLPFIPDVQTNIDDSAQILVTIPDR